MLVCSIHSVIPVQYKTKILESRFLPVESVKCTNKGRSLFTCLKNDYFVLMNVKSRINPKYKTVLKIQTNYEIKVLFLTEQSDLKFFCNSNYFCSQINCQHLT